MEKWRALLERTDLSEDQLREIPASSCENHINMLNYCARELRIPEEELRRGVMIRSEQFNDPKYWIDPIDERRFHLNIFRNSSEFLTHYDMYHAGENFRISANTVFQLIFRLLSAGQVFKESARHVRKFNNEYRMKTVGFKRGHCFFLIEDFPYYRNITLGHECRYVEGVYAANLDVHNIKNYSIRHIICGKTIEGLVKNIYGHLNWDYRDDGEYIFINGQKVGKHIALAKKKIGSDMVYTDREETTGRVPNAVRVIQDFTFNERLVFSRGEIYNAPYCLIEAEWKEPGFLKRFFSLLSFGRRLHAGDVQEMERQIEFANRKLFESQAALRASERKSRIFSIYTKASLVKKVDEGDDPVEYLPDRREMAVLFSDIRDFTGIAENMDPVDTVKFLNAYFNRMNRAIITHNGEIDKLIGDCIMAGFCGHGREQDALNAVRAALLMREELQNYNRERYEFYKTHICPKNEEAEFLRVGNGIGITFGAVVAGNIGSSDKLDYTVIGDAVNVASRLESLTKHYGVGILISEDVKEMLPEIFAVRFVDRVLVKGRSGPVNIYEVYDHEPSFIKTKKEAIREQLEKAFELYCNGDFHGAVNLYTGLTEAVGTHSYINGVSADPLIDFYVKRCREIEKRVARGDIAKSSWDGVYIFGEK